MLVLIDIVVIVALLKLLAELERPFLCAGIYAGTQAFFGLVAGEGPVDIILRAAVWFAIFALWFWIMTRFETGGSGWWTTLVLGFLLQTSLLFL